MRFSASCGLCSVQFGSADELPIVAACGARGRTTSRGKGRRMTAFTDLAHAPTSPFEPTDAHALLQRFAGSWQGTTRLWLEPGTPPEETLTQLRAQLIL